MTASVLFIKTQVGIVKHREVIGFDREELLCAINISKTVMCCRGDRHIKADSEQLEVLMVLAVVTVVWIPIEECPSVGYQQHIWSVTIFLILLHSYNVFLYCHNLSSSSFFTWSRTKEHII